MPDEEDRYLSPKSVAEMLEVTERTVHNWIAKQGLPSVKIGWSRRIKRADLNEFLERMKAG